MKLWKAHEKRTAQALGGKRAGATGQANEDVVGVEWLTIECKECQSLPAWLTEAVRQAVDYAAVKLTETLPIVVLHEKGRHQGNDLVVMRMKDFVDWYGATMRKDDPAYRLLDGVLWEQYPNEQ